MAVDFGSASSGSGTSVASYTVPVPSGTVNGSLLIAWSTQNAGSPAALTLTGGTTWNVLDSGSTIGANGKLYWKVAGSSEGTDYTVGQTSSSNGTTSIIRAINGSSATPVFATNFSGQSGTSISTPSVTPAGLADLLIRFVGASTSGTVTWTPPGSHTERTDIQSTGNGSSSTSATMLLASGAATGTANFTASANAGTALSATVAVTESSPQTVSPSGIASAEAFGTAQLNLTIIGTGIASGEAFGTTQVSTPAVQLVQPSGIASGEAFGVLTTRLYLGPTGIPSAEALGVPNIVRVIGPVGIASGEAFGLTNVARQQFITPTGVISAEAFGTLALQIGYPQTIVVEGIESGELVEDPTIRNADRLVLVNPSIQETPAAWDALNVRFGLHRGITIMKSGGVWRQVRYPAQTEIEVAERVYLGGRRHVLTVGEAEELIAAGYGAYIILEPDT